MTSWGRSLPDPSFTRCARRSRFQRIFFLNSGVKLAVEGSPVLDDLRALSERGVTLLATAPLEFYGLKEKLAVGEITNMCAIAEALMGAGKG